jgi:hypothetical protein
LGCGETDEVVFKLGLVRLDFFVSFFIKEKRKELPLKTTIYRCFFLSPTLKGGKKPLPSKKHSQKKLKNKSLLCTAKKIHF